MKHIVLIFSFSLWIAALSGQTQGNSIIASLIKLTDSSVAVNFVVGPSANLSGTGNPISVFLRIPASASPNSMSITLDNSNFNLALAQASDDGNGYFIYYFEGPPVDLNTAAWDNGVTTRVGVFKVRGYPGTIQLVGGQYGPAVANGSGGFSWPGTALLVNNTETNLVSWPINAGLSLPLGLSEFNLLKVGSYAELNWTTLTELNTSHFEIERRSDQVSWETLASIAAAGHSAIRRNYFYRDPLNSGRYQTPVTYYYRIKCLDLDQHFEYTPVKSLKMGGFPAIRLWNSLVRDRLILEYREMNETQLGFKVVDIQGRILTELISPTVSGNGTVEFTGAIRDLPAGVFHLINWSQKEFLPAMRFVKMNP